MSTTMARPRKPTKPAADRNKSRHAQPRKAFHGPPDLFAALEKYRAETRPQPSESECLRVALEEFLAARGYWPKGKDAGATPPK